MVKDLHTQVSEECLSSCLLAIAALTRQNSTTTSLLLQQVGNTDSTLALIVSHYLRYPNQSIRAGSAAIVAHCVSSVGEDELARITGQPQLLAWTLTTVINLINPEPTELANESENGAGPQDSANHELKTDAWILYTTSLVSSATEIVTGSRQMQRVAD